MGLLVPARRRWQGGVLCACLLGSAAPRTALAQSSSSDELAHRHFDSGVAYLEESDYDNALKAFEKAYELSQRPEILLNIATVHERKAELAPAIEALQRYLAVAPHGDNVEAVRLRIQNLQKRLSEAAPAATPPAAAGAAPAPAATPVAEPSAPPRADTAKSTPPAPAYSRVPVYIAFGVAGAAAGAAAVTGILAKQAYDDKKASCHTSCTDGELSSGRALALTSTVLTGAALLGVGLGVTLYFTGGAAHEQAASAPTLRVALAPDGARAHATWRF